MLLGPIISKFFLHVQKKKKNTTKGARSCLISIVFWVVGSSSGSAGRTTPNDLKFEGSNLAVC